MDKEKIIKDTFIAISSLILVAFLLEIVAITQFAGGSHVDPNTEGFDFVWNTLSDLGRDPAPNGEPNLTSRVLYRIAVFYMVFFGIMYHSLIWKFFTERKLTKYLSISGSLLGVVQGGIYVGVLFVESHPEHNNLIAVAAGCLIAAVLIYTIVFFLDNQFPRIIKWTYLTTFSLAVIYATIIFIGFLIKNNGGSNDLFVGSQRIGHTIFNWCLKISFIIQSITIYFHLESH